MKNYSIAKLISLETTDQKCSHPVIGCHITAIKYQDIFETVCSAKVGGKEITLILRDELKNTADVGNQYLITGCFVTDPDYGKVFGVSTIASQEKETAPC